MIRSTPAIRITAVFVLVCGLAVSPAASAEARAGVEAKLVVGRYAAWVDLYLDLDALLVGIRPNADTATRVRALERLREAELERAIARLERYVRRRVRIRFDGRVEPFRVHFPDQLRTPDAKGLLTLGGTVRLDLAVPKGAREVSFFASRSFGALALTVELESSGRRFRMRLERGQRSPPVRLQGEP